MTASGIPEVVTITANGVDYTGWSSVTCVRGLERFPSEFTISLTEHDPFKPGNVVIAPNTPITIKLGKDLIFTGWLEDYIISLEPNRHEVTIKGRSLCADVHDVSANLPSNQLNLVSLYDMATALCKPYGITVDLFAPDAGPTIAQFNVLLGETIYQIIERVARWIGEGFLIYDGEDGHLILSPVGALKMSSGITEGENVQSASVRYSMAPRFSIYTSVANATYQYADYGTAPNTQYTGIAQDGGVNRFRQMIIISESVNQDYNIADARVTWECNRRFGRSQVLRVTVDSWRTGTGDLWKINNLVNLNIPSCKLTNVEWLIAEVSFKRDLNSGTTADLTLYPPQAFEIEPQLLQQFDWDVQRALKEGGGDPSVPPAPQPGGGFEP